MERCIQKIVLHLWHLPEKKQINILTHFALPQGRNLGNFASATSKGIWRSCFVYVQKRAGGLHPTYTEWRGCVIFWLYCRCKVVPRYLSPSGKEREYTARAFFCVKSKKGINNDSNNRYNC